MTRLLRFVAIAIAAAGLAGAAAAQEIGNIDAGRAIAVKVCAQCHLVEVGKPPPRDVGAPPFAAVMARPDSTEFKLRAFLQTPHRKMPDFRFTRGEADDIIAYLLSLKPR